MNFNDIGDEKRIRYFSKRIFKACKSMPKDSKILALSWENQEDKETMVKVAKDLKELGLLTFMVSFSSLKITLTFYGQTRVNNFNDWYG